MDPIQASVLQAHQYLLLWYIPNVIINIVVLILAAVRLEHGDKHVVLGCIIFCLITAPIPAALSLVCLNAGTSMQANKLQVEFTVRRREQGEPNDNIPRPRLSDS
jgi:hypothetical protein